MRANLLSIAVATASLIAAAPAFAEVPSLSTAQKDPVGTYITDSEGRSLYMFEIDEQGGEGSSEGAASKCSGDCAATWPPLLTDGEPTLEGDINKDLVGTFQREDGKMQVTYNGWPLYYFAKDQAAGDTTGHDIDSFGGEWYLLTPAGEEAAH
jgi:predicted lipoprotein with Yx(FWY)xxD motif